MLIFGTFYLYKNAIRISQRQVRNVASEKNKRDQWRFIALGPLTFVVVANAQGQPSALEAAVRQHERASI